MEKAPCDINCINHFSQIIGKDIRDFDTTEKSVGDSSFNPIQYIGKIPLNEYTFMCFWLVGVITMCICGCFCSERASKAGTDDCEGVVVGAASGSGDNVEGQSAASESESIGRRDIDYIINWRADLSPVAQVVIEAPPPYPSKPGGLESPPPPYHPTLSVLDPPPPYDPRRSIFVFN